MLSKENRAKNRAKSLENKLPSIPSKENEKNAVEYVSLVYEGYDKVEAFKKIFPEQARNAEEFAISKGRDIRAMIMAKALRYEQGKYVSKVYELGRKDYWKKYIHKKTRLLDRAFDMAMDDDRTEKVNMMAMKLFLDNIPDMKEDNTVTVKHQISADKDFLAKIESRKRALLNSADEIIEAEVSDGL